MRAVVIFILTFSIIPFAYSGNDHYDSLWNFWSDESAEDANRLKAIHHFVDRFIPNNVDSGLYYSKMNYDYAMSINNRQFISNVRSNIHDPSFDFTEWEEVKFKGLMKMWYVRKNN